MTTYKKAPKGAQEWLRNVIARAVESCDDLTDDGDRRAYVLGYVLGAAGIESNDPREALRDDAR